MHLLNQIGDRQIVLPDLQRDFVWGPDQIRLLFDSLMQGYPFGSLLFWQTRFVEVPFRDFVIDFKPGMTFAPKAKREGDPKLMVLDGQQRLQSLYLGLRGTHDGKHLYFNVTSGPDEKAEQDRGEHQEKYRFEFWRDDEQANRGKRLIRVADVVGWSTRSEDAEIRRIVQAIPLEGDEADRAAANLRRLRSIVNQADLVAVETIDEEVSHKDQARSINEILDIFVRVNSGGTKLTRSDLMFSLIKSKWTGARHSFDDLLANSDPGHALGIDKDFLIRGLLVVADVPISFQVENIERHWATIQPKFDAFSDALKTAVDFCQEPDVGIRSASLLDPVSTLFPLVYYLSRQKHASVPDEQRSTLRSMIYFLLFNGFLRGASPEARLRHLREVLKAAGSGPVPLDNLLGVIRDRQRAHAIQTTVDMLNWNPRLALNIVQPGVCRTSLSWQVRAEVDHIFPQASYRARFPGLVDDIGNFAFLGKLRNIRKSDSPPWEYFGPMSDEELDRDYLVDRSLLRDDKFEEFVQVRRERILKAVTNFLGR